MPIARRHTISRKGSRRATKRTTRTKRPRRRPTKHRKRSRKNKRGGTPDATENLIRGITSKDLVKMRDAVDHAADVNDRLVGNGNTPVAIAIMHNNMDALRFLVEHGANVMPTPNPRDDPMTFVHDYGTVEMGTYLEEVRRGATTANAEIPVMTQAEFDACDTAGGDLPQCGISLEELERETAVKPPSAPSGTKQNDICFHRDMFASHLKRTRTHPITRFTIPDEWVDEWYPRGLP